MKLELRLAERSIFRPVLAFELNTSGGLAQHLRRQVFARVQHFHTDDTATRVYIAILSDGLVIP